MRRILVLVVFLLLFSSIANAEDSVLVTIKLMKSSNASANLPTQVEFPTGCSLCQAVTDPEYARENTREIVLAMRLPKSTPIDLHIVTPAADIRRVLLETADLAFVPSGNGLNVSVPPQIADRVNSGELQTHLYWPGVELRVEHADPLRRAGDYSSGAFPTVERQAALNLEFAMLDALRKLALDHYVDEQNLGRLWLMGFDTNFPHGHHDSPPHAHLVLRLPAFRGTGSLVPHLYLTPQGLLSHSLVGVSGWTAELGSLDFTAGKPFTSIDALGRPVFTLTITSEGWLNLSRFDGAECQLRPHAAGFQSGVKVACPHFSPSHISIEDDLGKAEIRESIDDTRVSTYHYDPDTGELVNP